jgi:hypothetical protein
MFYILDTTCWNGVCADRRLLTLPMAYPVRLYQHSNHYGKPSHTYGILETAPGTTGVERLSGYGL